MLSDTRHAWAPAPESEVLTIEEALGDGVEFTRQSAIETALYISQKFPIFRWVMVTGGEPAEQDLNELVHHYTSIGKKVALETSGTATGHVGVLFDWVCVSPKIGMAGGKEIIPAAVRMANEIKFVVGRPADLLKLEKFIEQYPLGNNTEMFYNR